jgi:hypothetical protein
MMFHTPRSHLLKEIYRSGRERIQYLLKMHASIYPDTLKFDQSPEDRIRSAQVLTAIRDSLQSEKSEDYRTAITQVCNWCLQAQDLTFQILCTNANKSQPYAIRQGLEFLQVALFRDLRKSVLAGEESRRYHIFWALVESLPTLESKTRTHQ